jgi:hypothetical protein
MLEQWFYLDESSEAREIGAFLPFRHHLLVSPNATAASAGAAEDTAHEVVVALTRDRMPSADERAIRETVERVIAECRKRGSLLSESRSRLTSSVSDGPFRRPTSRPLLSRRQRHQCRRAASDSGWCADCRERRGARSQWRY